MAIEVGAALPDLNGLEFLKHEPDFPLSRPPSARDIVLVLEFWATWCGPCVQTVPHLTKLQHEFKDKEVYVVGISMDQDPQKARQFVERMGAKMDYSVALDSQGVAQNELYQKSGATGIPWAFVVDHKQRIAHMGHPLDPAFDTALRAAAKQAGEKHQKQALPLVTATYEELMQLSIKELKALLADREVDFKDCVEKGDLARRVREQCSAVVYYK